jgi:hypothetical protein
MRAANLAAASLLAFVGGVVIWDAVRLGIGWGTDGPESGFFPFWLATIMLAVLGLIIVRIFLHQWTRPFVTRERARPVVQVLGPMVALVVAMQWLGLYLASVAYIAFSMRWLGRHSWLVIVLVAIGVPVVTFLVFERWFLVPMPKGPFEDWLGY